MQVGAVERRSAGHAAHRKYLQFDPLTGKIRIGLVPVNLRFHAPGVTLRNASLAHYKSQCDLPVVHVLANGPLGDLTLSKLMLHPHPDAMCCVALLARAFRSPSRIASINFTAAFSFHLGRSVFFRGLGNALLIASRTIRRCTPSFLATPAIVPIPNSYSRRICSYNSTFALRPTSSLHSGFARIRVTVRLGGWAKSNRRTGPDQSTEIKCV